MQPTSRRGATYADIEALPEHLVGELFGDELFVSPRPAPLHASVAMALNAFIIQLQDSNRGDDRERWRVFFEPELHLGADVMVPDAAAWRWPRMPSLPKTTYFATAPDWVCEIASPGSARLDRAYKLPRYAKAQVGHAWIINPPDRSLDALQLENGLWSLIGCFVNDDRAHIEPFTSLELDLRKLWPDESPSVHERGPRYG